MIIGRWKFRTSSPDHQGTTRSFCENNRYHEIGNKEDTVSSIKEVCILEEEDTIYFSIDDFAVNLVTVRNGDTLPWDEPIPIIKLTEARLTLNISNKDKKHSRVE